MISTLVFMLSLLPGIQATGTIAGKIVDADGRPLAGIDVRFFQKLQDEFGIERTEILSTAVTNELGEYRSSLVQTSATFYVAVTSQTYGDIYYPATRQYSAAAPLEVLPGQVLEGVDFTVAPAQFFSVRGKMVDALHVRQPHLSSVTLGRRHSLGPSILRPAAKVAPDGSFEFRDVPPGSYWLTGVRIDDEPNRSRSLLLLEVEDSDLDNVELIAAEGHVIKGRVRVEGPQIRQIRVALRPITDPARLLGPHSSTAANPNGRFELFNLPSGEYRLSIPELPDGYHIKSARFGSVDVLSNGISLRGVMTGSLEVVVSNEGGALEGTALDSAGRPAGGTVIVLSPAIQRPERTDLYKLAITDAAGRFKIDGVAPGDYAVFTADDVDVKTYRHPGFIERFKERTHRVTISIDQTTMLGLRSSR